MKLVDQWGLIEARLPQDWEGVRVTLTPEDPKELPRAAAVLGPLNAGLVDGALALDVRRAGGTGGPEAARRLFARLDEQRVWCTLTRGDVREAAPAELKEQPRPSVAQSWDDALATLPPDWSELLCRLEIAGSALLPRAALLCAPINPTRDRDAVGFVFRAGRVGYGVSTMMAKRCFERLDEDGIDGAVSVLRVLSDTQPVASQGSSWIVAGRVL
jgi:hypothetical protein